MFKEGDTVRVIKPSGKESSRTVRTFELLHLKGTIRSFWNSSLIRVWFPDRKRHVFVPAEELKTVKEIRKHEKKIVV